MSEPMTNHQIEDVLSSIRRLVSDDLRPRTRAAQGSDGGDKLLLTPALRIVPAGDADTPDPAAGDAVPENTSEAVDPAVPDLPFLARGQAIPDAEDDGAVAGDGAGPMVLHREAVVDADLARVEADVAEAFLAPRAPQGQGLVFRSRRDAEGPADGAGPEAFAAEAEPPLELAQPFWPVADAATEADVPAETMQRAGLDAGLADEDAPSADDAQPQGMVADHALPQVSAIDRDGIADTDLVPDLPVADLAAGGAEAGADHALASDAVADAEVAAALPPAPVPIDADRRVEADARPDDAAIPALDEDAMVALVRGIIHDELQGALGERITRNVRKLVRAEIQRMLASRDIP